MSITFAIRGEYIQLDQLLKATGLCDSGGSAHAAIAEGRLQARVGLDFAPERSQVLICGNPEMVKETQQTLLALGLAKNLRRAPGNISAENYW